MDLQPDPIPAPAPSRDARVATPLPPGGLLAPDSPLTTGPLGRTLFILAMPVLAEQMLNTFVGIFDTFLAGRISPAATAAVGLAAYVYWLAELFVMLVGTGTTAIVARLIGGRQPDEARRITNQSLTLAVVIGGVLSVLLYLMAPRFAEAQRMTGEAYDVAVQYLRTGVIGVPFLSVALVGCAALRGTGDMRSPMWIFAGVNLINVVASPAFMYGWGPLPVCGVRGIVLGTVVAHVFGGIALVVVLLRGRSGLGLRAAEHVPDWPTIRRILRIGAPAALDAGVLWTGHFIFISIIARLAPGDIGQAYYAASIIGVRVEALTYLPAVAWGAASATMIGQALGAGLIGRARRVGHAAVAQCGLLAVVMTGVFYFGAERVFDLMTQDPMVRAAGVVPLRCLAVLQVFLVASIIYVHSLRGAGDTRVPALITVLSTFMIRLPAAWYFGIYLQGGLLGAWIGMFGDILCRSMLATIRYTSGRWVHTAV